MVNEARAVRKRMLDDIERRRAALLAELERVRATLDGLAHDLAAPLVAPSEPDRPPDPPGGEQPNPEEPRPAEPRPDELFARLRAEQAHGVDATGPVSPDVAVDDTPPEPSATKAPEPPVAAPPEPPAAAPSEPTTPEGREAPSGDDAVRRRHDEMLAPLTPALLRASKRLLQDEHNELLDAVRRARGHVEAVRILPDPEKQRATWSAVLAPTIDQAYTVGRALTGRGRRPTERAPSTRRRRSRPHTSRRCVSGSSPPSTPWWPTGHTTPVSCRARSEPPSARALPGVARP